MSNNKTVKDLMVSISKYPHVPYWFSIHKAARIVKLALLNVKEYPAPLSVLVFDEEYNLQGTVTLKDLLKGLEHDKESHTMAERLVSEIMTPAKVFVEPNDAVAKAASLMIQNDLELLPVVDGKKKFVGLVRMIELFDEISNAILKE